jgi:hypothetical protein
MSLEHMWEQFQGVTFVNNEVWLVMELMPGGASLFG